MTMRPNTFFANKIKKSVDELMLRRLDSALEITLKQGTISSLERNEYSEIRDLLKEHQTSLDYGRDRASEKKGFSDGEIIRAASMEDLKIGDYLLYRYRFNHYPRKLIVPDFPIVLSIEPTSICNIRCTMCFQADPALSKDKSHRGLMEMSLYQKLVDEAARNKLASLVLASRGEPTLHPEFPAMIRYAKQKGILEVKINTNATKLTDELSRAILEAEPDILVFSVDSAKKDVFEAIRQGANFEQVVKNIERFHEIRAKEFPQSKTITRISMLDIDQDPSYSEKFWMERVDEFSIGGVSDVLDIYSGSLSESSQPCMILWERLFIAWDGTINPCDNDYLFKLSLGKVEDKNTIKAIWHSQAMEHYRQQHKDKLKNVLFPCNRCQGR